MVSRWVSTDTVGFFLRLRLEAAPFAMQPLEVNAERIRLIEPLPLPLALLKTALFLRRLPELVGAHDVLISGSNEVDFGRPGIQYIHYPWTLRPRPEPAHTLA